jgi:recombination protein RecA
MSACLLAEASAEENSFTKSLREQLGNKLICFDQLKTPEGLPTGISTLDRFLLWKGLPKGDLTLLRGPLGTGGTSLWLNAARIAHSKKKWTAWINTDWELMPTHLVQRKLDLNRLLVVEKPETQEKLFYILQELLTSCLFEMIGCPIDLSSIKTHHLYKLKKLAQQYKVALVFISKSRRYKNHPIFSLIVNVDKDFLCIQRALHRPTPFHIARDNSETQLNYTGRNLYENFMRELATRDL